MTSLPRGFGDRRAHRAFRSGNALLILGLAVALGLESGTAEGQVTITVQGAGAEEAPAEAAAADTTAPAAPEDPTPAVPAAEEAALTPEAAARQQVEQMAAQYEPMLTRVLQDDLELLRTLHGDLPVEARRAIAAAGQSAVKAGALALSAEIHGPRPMPVAPPRGAAEGLLNAVGRAFGFPIPEEHARRADGAKDPEAGKGLFDPCQGVIDAVAASLVEQVGEAAAATFLEELSKREQRCRAVDVRRLVGRLEDDLFLNAKQREAIEDVLSADSDDGIAMALDHTMELNGRKIYPGLPYDRVLPHLNPAQRTLLGNGKESLDFARSNRQSMMQSRFFRRANLSQQAQRDSWWFE
ncbi:MAG: hypothetical protein WCJ31_16920 [Planctomycetia bacterium]